MEHQDTMELSTVVDRPSTSIPPIYSRQLTNDISSNETRRKKLEIVDRCVIIKQTFNDNVKIECSNPSNHNKDGDSNSSEIDELKNNNSEEKEKDNNSEDVKLPERNRENELVVVTVHDRNETKQIVITDFCTSSIRLDVSMNMSQWFGGIVSSCRSHDDFLDLSEEKISNALTQLKTLTEHLSGEETTRTITYVNVEIVQDSALRELGVATWYNKFERILQVASEAARRAAEEEEHCEESESLEIPDVPEEQDETALSYAASLSYTSSNSSASFSGSAPTASSALPSYPSCSSSASCASTSPSGDNNTNMVKYKKKCKPVERRILLEPDDMRSLKEFMGLNCRSLRTERHNITITVLNGSMLPEVDPA